MGVFIEIAVGIVAYVFYFVYDYNSITRKNKIFASLFTIGTLMIAGSTVSVLIKYHTYNVSTVVFSLIALLFFVLLIYTLFFALPFEETYIKESKLRKTYTGGVYSICRHPGVLWLAGMYLCLMAVSSNVKAAVYYSFIIVGDILYVIYQDMIIFPKTFVDYVEYKKTTPFLIPSFKKRK